MHLLVLSIALATQTVCMDDRVGIGSHARHAFDQELIRLAGTEVRLDSQPCAGPSRIRLSIRAHAPARYRSALGLAYTANGRVLPVIELYSANIVSTLDGRAGSQRFGRALARVAFHELQHYLRQEHGHDDKGLFAPALSLAHLRE